jgi:hypothetical protein
MANKNLTVRQIAEKILADAAGDWSKAEKSMHHQVEQSLDVCENWVKQLLRPYVGQAVWLQIRKAAKARDISHPTPATRDCINGLRGVVAMYKQAMDANQVRQDATAEQAAEIEYRKVAKQAAARAHQVMEIVRLKAEAGKPDDGPPDSMNPSSSRPGSPLSLQSPHKL